MSARINHLQLKGKAMRKFSVVRDLDLRHHHMMSLKDACERVGATYPPELVQYCHPLSPSDSLEALTREEGAVGHLGDERHRGHRGRRGNPGRRLAQLPSDMTKLRIYLGKQVTSNLPR